MIRRNLTGVFADTGSREELIIEHSGFSSFNVKSTQDVTLKHCAFQGFSTESPKTVLEGCRLNVPSVNHIFGHAVEINSSAFGTLNISSRSLSGRVLLDDCFGRELSVKAGVVGIYNSRIDTLNLNVETVELSGHYRRVNLRTNKLLGIPHSLKGVQELKIVGDATTTTQSPRPLCFIRCGGRTLRSLIIFNRFPLSLELEDPQAPLNEIQIQPGCVQLLSDVETDTLVIKTASLTGESSSPLQRPTITVNRHFVCRQESQIRNLEIQVAAGATMRVSPSCIFDNTVIHLGANARFEASKRSTFTSCSIQAHPSAIVEPLELRDAVTPLRTGIILSESATYWNTRLPNGYSLNS